MKDSKYLDPILTSMLSAVGLAFVFLLAAPFLFAQNVPLSSADSNTQTCTTITSTTWVAVPTTPLGNRRGFWQTNPSTITLVGSSDSTLPVTSSSAPFVLPGLSMQYFNFSNKVTLYWHLVGPSGVNMTCSDEVTQP